MSLRSDGHQANAFRCSPTNVQMKEREGLPVNRVRPIESNCHDRTVGRCDLNYVSVLKTVGLFANLTEKELGFIASRTLLRRLRVGQLIFSEGDFCEGLYVVASGTVKVFETSVSGRELVLRLAGPGDSIGETPIFDGGDHPSSAVAVSETNLLLIQTRDFRSLCLQHPEIALKVLKEVASRLRRAYSTIEALSFTTVRQRLATLLIKHAEGKGRQTRYGVGFKLNETNLELAAQIGTVRELVSRNLKSLQAEGLIIVQGRNVIIRDLERMKSRSTFSWDILLTGER